MSVMMRVTNQIMTNNTLSNINTNKVNLMNIEEQYQTGKKIQRPSDDPVVAVRALKLRNNLTEIKQYYKKNVPDAKSWIQVTESALTQVTDICSTLHQLANQGSNGTLTPSDRMSIMKTMQQYRKQIYQEGDASYAGRYVFTGYKTDTSLTYLSNDKSKRYTITEDMNKSMLKTSLRTYGGYSASDYEAGGANEFSEHAENKEVNYIRLSYKKLDKAEGDYPKLTYRFGDEEDDVESIDITSENEKGEPLNSNDPTAYIKPESGAKYIADTGELILSDEAYEKLKNAKSFSAVYNKTEFSTGDVRPEHYFNCQSAPLDAEGNPVEDESQIIKYKKEDQDIEYEVSFNQRLQINTQAKDALTQDLGRELDGILSSIEDVNLVENKIKEVDKIIKNTTDKKDLEGLNRLKTQMNTELKLKEKVMQERFSKAINGIRDYQDVVNKAIADLGSRDARLDLTEQRLSGQTDDFTDLMSNNENADLAETIINFNAQKVIYNASLQAGAKVVQNTLLDFLR